MVLAIVTGERDKSTKDHNSPPTWVANKLMEHGHSSFLTSAPLILWMVDQSGVFTLSQGNGLSSLGLKTNEVLGKSLEIVFADSPQFVAYFQKALHGETVQSTTEFSGMTWEGVFYPIVSLTEGITGAIGAIFNITEQRKTQHEQNVILDIAAALRTIAMRAEMPQIIFNKLEQFLQASHSALVLRNPHSGELHIEFSHGEWQSSITPFSTSDNENRMTLSSRQIVATGQPYVNNGFSDESIGLQGIAGVPLIAQEIPIGALWVGRDTPITNDEISLLSAIGSMTANALHRAAQHERTERRLSRIAALHAIDQAITNSLDLRVTLSVLLDQVIRQLDIDAADVLLYDAEFDKIIYADGRGFNYLSLMNTTLHLGEGVAGEVALKRKSITIKSLPQHEHALVRKFLVGKEAFITYYGVPLIARGKMKGVLEIFNRQRLDVDHEWLDFLNTLATQAAIAIDNAELFRDIQRYNAELDIAYTATLEGWVRALDLRDKETEGHTQRVTKNTLHLARMMGLREEELIHVHRGALLHDIGKIGIPDEILKKQGPLEENEWELMRKHPCYAHDMLSEITFLQPALDIPYCHHEKWDGSGYPRGLKGEQIPLTARIFALIDVWDALRSDRPYRHAWQPEEANAYILSQSGKHFDPRVVHAWKHCYNI